MPSSAPTASGGGRCAPREEQPEEGLRGGGSRRGGSGLSRVRNGTWFPGATGSTDVSGSFEPPKVSGAERGAGGRLPGTARLEPGGEARAGATAELLLRGGGGLAPMAPRSAPSRRSRAQQRGGGASAARGHGRRPGPALARGGAPPGAWGWSGPALAAQALLLLLIFALSALGNGAVVLVVARHRQLRTVTNAFVLSLSLAELLAALLCLPPALLSLLSGRPRGAWLFGQRLCLASAALHAGLGIAATLTMALLAFDRYCAIVRQPRRRLGRRRAAQLLAGVWLAALGVSGPWYLLAQEDEEEEERAGGAAPCMYVLPWSSSRLGPPYSATLIALCYLLPFSLMCFCHYGICRALRLSARRVRPLHRETRRSSDSCAFGLPLQRFQHRVHFAEL
uniref:G protein-coupled receptor 135 n=1 Tax=Varanus komodoensis TaxID=61221 RepID=A0A8D2IY45_VARKO